MFGVRQLARGRCLRALSLCVLIVCLFADASAAQEKKRRATRSDGEAAVNRLGELINQNTIAIVSGNLNGTYVTIAYDLSAVLDDGDNLRVLPIIGKGGAQNIRDVRFMKGVDLGITQSNLLGLFRRTNEIGPIDEKLVYIAKLFNEELHVIVRADSGITSIEQLQGKRINFSDIGSGTQLSTRDIFERLGIKTEEVNMGQADAFEKLKSGEIAASVLIAGKPAGSIIKLKASDGYRLLPVPYPKQLQNDYLPATLSSDTYPGLIEPGRAVDTVAVGAVLFAYNWPKGSERHRRIEKFVQAFFPKLAEFQQPPRHVKWRETNLAAVLPGWTRFEPAQAWLDNNRAQIAAATRGQFEQFLVSRGGSAPTRAVTPEEREKLFQEFLQWNQARERR
jgi:TRAP transporter TAXI family solute receptor